MVCKNFSLVRASAPDLMNPPSRNPRSATGSYLNVNVRGTIKVGINVCKYVCTEQNGSEKHYGY